jgi:hypothetical protein
LLVDDSYFRRGLGVSIVKTASRDDRNAERREKMLSNHVERYVLMLSRFL